MENPVQRKKNIELLEDIQLTLKCLSEDTTQLKQDVRYIKTLIQMKDKVEKDREEHNIIDKASSGWFW
jgi:hypothetical protein